jgi:hypothetical protein
MKFLSAGCSLLRAESFSWSLEVLYGGNIVFFSSCIFFVTWSLKPRIWIWISIQLSIRIWNHKSGSETLAIIQKEINVQQFLNKIGTFILRLTVA